MTKLRSSLISSGIVILLSANLYAAEIFTVQNMSLKDALEKISKESKLSYMVDESLIKGKLSPNIKNIEGIKKALKAILSTNKLEAIIENDTIIIKKKVPKKEESSSSLGEVEVIERVDNTTEGSNSYTIDSMSTATKMNLSIKETPQSVSVLTHKQMEDLNIQTISDALHASTGVSVKGNGVSLPGYFSRAFVINDFQVDGIPTEIASNSWGTSQNMGMYDRVEIIKGANGLVLGAGDPSASLNFIRKKAKAKEFKGNIEVELGSWNKKRVSLDIQSPLNNSGDLRARIVANEAKADSFVDLLKTDKSLLYATIEKDISDNTLLTLGMSHQENKIKGATVGGLVAKFSDGSATSWDISQTQSSSWAIRETKQKRYFAKLEHTFQNDAKVSLEYAFGEIDHIDRYSKIKGTLDKNTGAGLTESINDEVAKYKHRSLNLYTSVPFEFNDLEHELIAGYSYSKVKQDLYYSYPPEDGRDIPNYYTFNGSSKPTWDPEFDGRTTIRNKAIYAATRLSLSEDTKIIVGARLSDYESNDSMYPDWYQSAKNVVTPYFGITHNINDTYTLYASYTDIFKTQRQVDTSGKLLDPIVGKNFETGIKATFLDDKINASFSVYKMIQDNLAQKDEGKTTPKGDDAYKAANGATVKGFETEISGALSNNLNITAGFSQFSLKNAKQAYSNKNLNLNANYKWNKISMGTGLRWNNRNKDDEVKALTLVHLTGGYAFSNNLSLNVNIDNIFGKKYKTRADSSSYVYGEPRKISVRLKYTF